METNLIPFGVQYYRAPTPLQSDWESDLQNIKKSGFNTIKIWAQWRWNNPSEGVYDFSDIIKLMDLSLQNDLKVIVNIILDVAPVWFYRKHPESLMIKANGEKLYPQAVDCRQIGGAPGPCYHHEEAKKYKRQFVEALAAAIGCHKALYLWDLWNEPELTCSIARQASQPDMVCYCDASVTAFQNWLQEKYGHIGALNDAWHRNYRSFDEVEAPCNGHTFKDMVDWRTFFADTLVEDLKLRKNAVKRFDKFHPVMVHIVPLPAFNMINACCDDYKMAKECDWFGNSVGSFPLPAALTMSNACGKPVINAEIHAVGGETFNRPGLCSYNDFKRHIFIPFSRGIKGFVYWQYRPERLGRESPAWGLTDVAGNSAENLEMAARIHQLYHENAALMESCKPCASPVAIIKDNAGEIFSWCASRSTDLFHSSIMGAFDALHHIHQNIDVLSADQALEKGLSSYQMVYYPLPYYMNGKLASAIAQYIREGGAFVSEALFGAYRDDDGLHSPYTPGYEFDKVFGARELRTLTASHFFSAYGENQGDTDAGNGYPRMECRWEGQEFSFPGYHFFEELQPTTAVPLACFSNGSAAATIHSYGRGKAVLIGTLAGAAYHQTQDPGILRLFTLLTQAAGISPNAWTDTPRVRADILFSETQAMLVVCSNQDAPCVTTVHSLTRQPVSAVRDMETGQSVSFEEQEQTFSFQVSLKPQEIRLFSISF